MTRSSLTASLFLAFHMSLSAGQPLIVAHRGASYDAPENTLAAFRLAWEKGTDAVEGDFYLTRDGRVACFHDRDTKRVAGREGKISDMTWAEVQSLDVGKWKHARYEGEKVPSLEQVLELIPEGKFLLIEIKTGPEIVPSVRRILLDMNIRPESVRIIAFDQEVIRSAKIQIPEVKAFWLTSFKKDDKGMLRPTPKEILATLKDVRADGLDARANPDVMTPAFVKQLHDLGYEAHCWTVNDPELALQMQAAGMDSITTDRPAFLRQALK